MEPPIDRAEETSVKRRRCIPAHAAAAARSLFPGCAALRCAALLVALLSVLFFNMPPKKTTAAAPAEKAPVVDSQYTAKMYGEEERAMDDATARSGPARF